MLMRNIERARQLNDFEGFLGGKFCLTDIDGLFEYNDLAYVFLEVKYGGKDLPYCQRRTYERLVKDTSSGGKLTIAIVIDHNVIDPNDHVPIPECFVREMYYCKEKMWRKPNRKITVNELVRKFVDYVEVENGLFIRSL
jgi:hypothetical protein